MDSENILFESRLKKEIVDNAPRQKATDEPKDTSANTLKNTPLQAAKESCNRVANIEDGNVNKMGAELQKMAIDYYEAVKKQANESFRLALIAAMVGTVFFVIAAALSMSSKIDSAKLSLISGTLIEIISAINFFLYAKTARQFSSFHICLERMNRFILANTMCYNIVCGIKQDDTRRELIQTMANAPMLTLNVMGGKEVSKPKRTIMPQTSKN